MYDDETRYSTVIDKEGMVANEQRLFHDRIIENPNIMAGKPVVAGTRVPVERVLAHLAETPDLDDLFAAFPHLTIEDVQACLAFAQRKLADDLVSTP